MNKIVVPGFDRINGFPLMVYHEFSYDDVKDVLVHFINGALRAEVPLQGMEQYVEQYPDAAQVIPVVSSQQIVPELEEAIKREGEFISSNIISSLSYLEKEKELIDKQITALTLGESSSKIDESAPLTDLGEVAMLPPVA
jgi:membrane protease subunit (stomatin/prohibitin family)